MGLAPYTHTPEGFETGSCRCLHLQCVLESLEARGLARSTVCRVVRSLNFESRRNRKIDLTPRSTEPKLASGKVYWGKMRPAWYWTHHPLRQTGLSTYRCQHHMCNTSKSGDKDLDLTTVYVVCVSNVCLLPCGLCWESAAEPSRLHQQTRSLKDDTATIVCPQGDLCCPPFHWESWKSQPL